MFNKFKRIKIGGITKRWMLNVLSVTAAVILVIEIFTCVIVYNYYNTNAKNKANELCSGYNLLSTCSKSEFNTLAFEYIENFKYKDQIEVDILDSSGNIVVSSTGFASNSEAKPDYYEALKSYSKTAYFIGKSSVGEKIMAKTEILSDFGSGSNGAVRWIISMSKVDTRIRVINIFVILLGAAILIFSALTGMYFINSIVLPVTEVSKISRRIAAGEFSARIKINSDDEIGELCNGINYMASELEQSEEIKNNFISSISHELRTPLTAIRGWGETAKMSVTDSDDEIIKKALDVILTESERLSGLVEDLLDFSRMQSGRLKVSMQKMDILKPLTEAVDMYRELAKKQNIEMTLNTPKELPPVLADINRIKQVFINVIDNAVKYTENGGQVLVTALVEEGCINIRVTDTGVGIPSQDIDRVKEKFYKANTNVRGSGIGLAVADEIIKQHNGLLFLESTEGVGTTVSIVLPIVLKEESDKEEVKTEQQKIEEKVDKTMESIKNEIEETKAEN